MDRRVGSFRLACRPLRKARFSFKFLLKYAHSRPPVWEGSSGRPGGRLQKLGFLLNFFEKLLIFALPCGGVLLAGRLAASKS